MKQEKNNQPKGSTVDDPKDLKYLDTQLQVLKKIHHIQEKQDQLQELTKIMDDPEFWQDPNTAKQISKKHNIIKTTLDKLLHFEQEITHLQEFEALLKEEPDKKLTQELDEQQQSLASQMALYRFQSLMDQDVDSCDAYLEIHPGAGGTESNDWAAMLNRMYTRFVERRHWTWNSVEWQAGDEAGIKSCTLKIKGDYAYGWLKYESGVHRLVRISPFDSGKRRHTSFAAIYVYPVIDDSIHIDMETKDLRIDTQRSSGAGGQHVNKTDSAVRITHIPTGLFVVSQGERSQIRNRDTAMKMLRAKLYQRELEKKQQQSKNTYENKVDISFGSQIRSYVLHPYQMVKDIRTGYESSQPAHVLDGDIDDFLEHALEKVSLL